MKMPFQILSLICFISMHAYGFRIPTVLVRPDDPRIRCEGRWDFSDPLHPRNSWPGTAIRAEFSGTLIGVRMADSDNYYNVTIDGRFHSVFHGDQAGEADYLLAGGLDEGRHTLILSKRNISFGPAPVFSGILLQKGHTLLEPASEPSRRIEFIGDSFTAAEGNEAIAAEMPWEEKKPVTNIDKGFAGIIAAHFSAEIHATCRSGIGMVCDWQGDTTVSMPLYFGRTLMESAEPVWHFHRWKPDLIVLCLGLNDHSGLKSPDGTILPERSERFRRTYADFLGFLRSVYPGVRILAVAADTPWIRENVRRVVEEENAAGRKDVYYAQFDYFPGGTVANGHPDAGTHRKIADVIIQAIGTMGVFGQGK
jgi:hypothetical protein